MDFPALAGNGRLKQQLSQREEGRGLSHAYLIAGPKGSGRHTLAKELAAAMVCTAPAGQRPCHKCPPCKKVLAGVHPDVNFISGGGEGKPIAVDQVRALRADAYVRPNEGQRKVYVLEGADQMNASAQNAMLKLLEEGPDYAAFLLLAENGSGVLETVRSRCVLLKYDAVSEDALPPEAEQLCRAFARGKVLPVTTYLVALENRRMKREELRDVLRSAWCAAAEALLLQMGKQTPDPACGETAQALARGLTARQLRQLTALLEKYSGECEYNVGAGHVLGALAVEWEELL